MPPHSILVKAALLVPEYVSYFPTLTCTQQIFNCLAPCLAGPSDSQLHDFFFAGRREYAIFRRAETFRFATRLVFYTSPIDDDFRGDEIRQIINAVDYLQSLVLRRFSGFLDARAFGEGLSDFLSQLPHLERLALHHCQPPHSFFPPLLKARSLSLRCQAAELLSDHCRDDFYYDSTFLRDIVIPAIDAAQTNGELVAMLQLVHCLGKASREAIDNEIISQMLQRIENCAAQAANYLPLRATALAAFAWLCQFAYGRRFSIRYSLDAALHHLAMNHRLWSDCAAFLKEFEQRHASHFKRYTVLIKAGHIHSVIDEGLLREVVAVTHIVSAFSNVLADIINVPSSSIRVMATPLMRLRSSAYFTTFCSAVRDQRLCLSLSSTKRVLHNRVLSHLWDLSSDECSRLLVQTLLDGGFIKELCLDLHQSSHELAAKYVKLQHRLGRGYYDRMPLEDSRAIQELSDSVQNCVQALQDVLCLHALKYLHSDDDKVWVRDTLLPTLFARSVEDANSNSGTAIEETYDLGAALALASNNDVSTAYVFRELTSLEHRVSNTDSRQPQQPQPPEHQRRRQREENGESAGLITQPRRFVREAVEQFNLQTIYLIYT